MAPSQEYLELLDRMHDIAVAESIDAAAQWMQVDWHDVVDASRRERYIQQHLLFLAASSIAYILAQKNSSLQLIIDEMRSLHIRKNAGYTGDNTDPWWNFRQCEVFGITAVQGVLTRLSDKISRFQMLRQNIANEQVGESILDTVMDIASYALIAVCLLSEKDNSQ
jgi:hypothetical protein